MNPKSAFSGKNPDLVTSVRRRGTDIRMKSFEPGASTSQRCALPAISQPAAAQQTRPARPGVLSVVAAGAYAADHRGRGNQPAGQPARQRAALLILGSGIDRLAEQYRSRGRERNGRHARQAATRGGRAPGQRRPRAKTYRPITAST